MYLRPPSESMYSHLPNLCETMVHWVHGWMIHETDRVVAAAVVGHDHPLCWNETARVTMGYHDFQDLVGEYQNQPGTWVKGQVRPSFHCSSPSLHRGDNTVRFGCRGP